MKILFVLAQLGAAVSLQHTISKNNVISSVRKRDCALELRIRIRVVRARVRVTHIGGAR